MDLRKTLSILLAVVMTVMNSCEHTAYERYGFDLPVSAGTKGENNIRIDIAVVALHLTGSICASEGSITAEVISPAGTVVSSLTANAPDAVRIKRIIPAEPGVWQLRYRSLTGTGYVRMHVTLEI